MTTNHTPSPLDAPAPAPQAGGTTLPTLEEMALDQWWCPACRTANRSFRIRCRNCCGLNTKDAIRSLLYSIPEKYI